MPLDQNPSVREKLPSPVLTAVIASEMARASGGDRSRAIKNFLTYLAGAFSASTGHAMVVELYEKGAGGLVRALGCGEKELEPLKFTEALKPELPGTAVVAAIDVEGQVLGALVARGVISSSEATGAVPSGAPVVDAAYLGKVALSLRGYFQP